MTSDEEPGPEVDEAMRVYGWRLEELERAGYPFNLAQRIAASDADLHVAVGLRESGCAPETAAEILL